MKNVYLVGRIDNKGNFTGKIDAFSSLKKAREQQNYLNYLFKTYDFITEKVIIN